MVHSFLCHLIRADLSIDLLHHIMNIRNQIFAFALFALAFASCSDDDRHADEPVMDDYRGSQSVLTMTDETASLSTSDIELIILTPDGSEITRRASHSRSGNRSTIRMDVGLREGEYRLLAARYKNPENATRTEFPTVEYGLGSRIQVTDHGISIIDPFDSRLGYAGKGTKSSPYIVSSSSHLMSLMLNTNDYDTWREIPAGTYFQQVRDIDMKQASRSCDMEYGWLPIGADTNTPFRGVYLGDGHKITNLIINRPTSPGLGLFGYILNATIDGLTMRNCSVTGQFAAATLAGASITSAASRGTSTITNCSAEGCTVKGNDSSVALGSLLGAADMYTKTLIANCTVTDGSVQGGMNAGGIMGASGIFTSTALENCSNSAKVSSRYSGAGGIVGTADTLQVLACRNFAEVTGALSAADGKYPGIGAGGIAGGAGMSWITASTNSGAVSGHEGVGGIVGSTRVRGSNTEGYQYNQSLVRHCANTAKVTGERFVGGAIGEAQAGGYGVCNTGNVSGTEYVGGVCGNSSISVIHNSVNTGQVDGERYVAGIVGKTTWGSLAIDQNYGAVTGRSGITAGVAGLAGNNTVVHYCANYGGVTGPGNHPVGGIIGEIGDPRKWTAMNIAECVVGSLECIMAVAGPVLAVVEETVEIVHGVEVALKIIEFSADACLNIADYTLFGFGLEEMINPEMEEELSADIKAETYYASAEVTDMIRNIRNSAACDVMNFNTSTFNSAYTPNIFNTQHWYEIPGHDEWFNDAINEAREERAEANEKVTQAKEVFHTCIAGVAILTSTVALIGSTVASGGLATAFVAAGSAAAIVGGVNAILKTCTEFENNAVVISQCVNAGTVSSHGNGDAGAIVGKLYDGCQLADNLNVGKLDFKSRNVMYGSEGKHCDVKRNVSTYFGHSYGGTGFTDLDDMNMLICDPECKDDYYTVNDQLFVKPAKLAEKGYYKLVGIDFSKNNWALTSDVQFAVPFTSVMITK